MNAVLWGAQILLALALLLFGLTHALRREKAAERAPWMLAVPRPALAAIGVLEVLGAAGLVLPWAMGVQPWLTPLAGIAVALLMALAAGFHARRSGEVPNIALNTVLGLVAAFIAYGRVVLVP